MVVVVGVVLVLAGSARPVENLSLALVYHVIDMSDVLQ
jgi:hypothetical protein